MRTAQTFCLFILAGALAGCSDELATGYKPQKLGVTDAERRAYYAPPFSPEATAALQESKANQSRIRRPTGY